eukprot:g15914.t1
MFRRKVVASLATGVLCCVHGGAAQLANCTSDWLIFDCEPPPVLAAVPCAAGAPRAWVVETPAQARALAAAVNCSGGSFEVEWRGTVVVDEPIYVVDGTILAVTGANSEAVIDGNSATRLFTVIDAALHVSGVNMSSGAGIVGGAIAAAGSILTLNRTNFAGNSATAGSGGAVYASGGSTVTFVGGETFADNRAASDGGAFYATAESVLSWSGEIHFSNNSCNRFGGALAIESSTVDGTGNAVFFSNSANGGSGYGGAIAAFSRSSVSLSGELTLFQDNFAGYGGGALMLSWSSEMSWSGSCHFLGNNASADGGAVIVGDSTLSWDGQAEFTGNTATLGGAIYLNSGSDLSWSGKSVLSTNYAAGNGGAIVLESSSASWTGDTDFFNNRAENYGGAVFVDLSSTILSTGGTTVFSNNSALTRDSGFGGGVNVAHGSSATWGGELTKFQGNSAGNSGGAFSVHQSEMSCTGPCQFSGNSAYIGGALTVSSSYVSWSADTALVGNTAKFGGAMFVFNGSNVTWTGPTEFLSNEARSDGGAISSPTSDASYSPLGSTLAMHGTTSFANNTSGGSGGAVALLGGCALETGTVDITFRSNTADVAGGAVVVSGTGLGPTFSKVSFFSNSAQVGGAVSLVGSGNIKDTVEVEALNPSTFDGCLFVGNTATATGGAVESAAGQDAFIRSFFEGNKAGTGGALRLAGTASVDNCSFVDNVSDEEEGAAVSNIGFISRMAEVSFSGNAFDCQPGKFLDFNPRSPFEAICDGCETQCDNCSFDEPLLEPTCEVELEHSNSSGGMTTIETLSVEPGYWRATTVSENVFECYNADACLGGLTGTTVYCLDGYEGPYCAVCSDGYTAQLGFTCSTCLGSASGIVLASVVLAVVLLAAVAVASYVISAEGAGKRRGLVERVARYIPLQSLKIIIVSWQLLTQFTSVANVTFPNVYQRLLDGLNVFNFDLYWILSAGCIVEVDFHDRLLLSSLGPIVTLVFLAGTYAAASRLHRGEEEALRRVWNKHVSMVLLLTFFVYASVSSTLFQAFACEHLDDGKNYLRADYRIECDSSKHRRFQVYAGFMVLLYALGIPAFYGVLLFRDRDILRRDEANRVDTARVTSTSDLWSPYKPSVFYYEVIECGRRILLAGVVVFIYPNTAAQIAITLMMAFVFAMLSEGLAPYASRWDAWLNRLGHSVVFVSLFVALLLKVDVTNERRDSQKIFEVFLVVVHACMILVVVVETAVLAWALKVEQLEEPTPRFRRGKSFSRGKWGVTPADGEDVLEDEEEAAPF